MLLSIMKLSLRSNGICTFLVIFSCVNCESKASMLYHLYHTKHPYYTIYTIPSIHTIPFIPYQASILYHLYHTKHTITIKIISTTITDIYNKYVTVFGKFWWLFLKATYICLSTALFSSLPTNHTSTCKLACFYI